jgi:hypothetical protein
MMKGMAFLILILLCMGCKPKKDHRLKIRNNSNVDVIYLQSESQDTSSYDFISCAAGDVAHFIGSGEEKPVAVGIPWESILDKPGSKMMFFVYTLDTVQHYVKVKDIPYSSSDCDQLKGRHLKRFDVTMAYLEQNNWTLVIQ